MAPQLRLAPGATRFKVLQFTDLHVGVNSVAAAQTLEVMRSVLAAEPAVDLVVYSGDLVNADDMRAPHSTLNTAWFEAQWALAVSPLRGLVPHAIALGNHDLRGTLDAAAVLEVALAQPGSLVQRPEAPGDNSALAAPEPFNYFIDVLAPNGTLAHRLWFLNSWDNLCEGRRPWGCVSRSEVAWATEAAAAAPTPAADSIAFVHIPLPQLRPDELRGVSGVMQEAVSCPSVETGVAHWARLAGISAVFSGHDHSNDYAGLWTPSDAPRRRRDEDAGRGDALLLAYGRTTGYGGYSPGSLQRGARVIEMHADGTLKTWIRQEDGSRIDPGGPFDVLVPPPSSNMLAWLLPLSVAVLALTMHALVVWRRRRVAKSKAAAVTFTDEAAPEPLLRDFNTLDAMMHSGYNS